MPVTINGSAGVTTNSGAVYNGLQTDTAKASTSGTSIDFTGIPSWVKRITVMFSGVSTNGTGNLQIQLGTSGGIQITGYLSEADQAGTGVNATTGFILTRSIGATSINHGIATIALIDSSTGLFACSGTLARSDTASGSFFGGSKSLSGTLDRIRIIGSTTGNPADTFDAGTINIIYE